MLKISMDKFLDIHIYNQSINIMSYDYLKKPILAKEIETVKGKGFVMTSCEMQGWRRTMEDTKLHVEL